ncbi:hypothetical protein B0H16DRAFT_1634845 [Mycena metata]|uniref:Uncharacterized protein n=1 Tax=Mycena metata TaxID=1033252 RepID=A0AAD7M983_9AGAR|nr:hypothetical protein B0H16DRAFT_1634845 [Mycena metata]
MSPSTPWMMPPMLAHAPHAAGRLSRSFTAELMHDAALARSIPPARAVLQSVTVEARSLTQPLRSQVPAAAVEVAVDEVSVELAALVSVELSAAPVASLVSVELLAPVASLVSVELSAAEASKGSPLASTAFPSASSNPPLPSSKMSSVPSSTIAVAVELSAAETSVELAAETSVVLSAWRKRRGPAATTLVRAKMAMTEEKRIVMKG